MFHYKFQRIFIALDEIHTVFVARSVDAKFAAIGFEFIHLLAESVIDAHRAEVFALQGHEVVGGIRIKGGRSLIFFHRPSVVNHDREMCVRQVARNGDDIGDDALARHTTFDA